MKRFIVYLAFLFVAVVAIDKYDFSSPVGEAGAGVHSECVMNRPFGHYCVAYAENVTFVQWSSGNRYSPRGGFPTVEIGSNIPSPSYNVHTVERSGRIRGGKVPVAGIKTYVLRV